ncbi:hypothetical protein MNBD_GAMMA15-1412 [hydrothermal vent metagenome]|uniref:DUF4340 domain-containing protein n=1 Tax=hydrothermal vent metagenome TaxID=652676 RepID=A0A3B0YTY3_9ZZZZ
MKSRWLINLLLFVTVAILILVARYEPGIEKTQTQNVTPITADDVTQLRVERQLRDELILEKDKEGFWWIAREPRLPADSFQVRALTRLAEQTVVRSYPASELDLAQLELDPPRTSLMLNTTRIDFGGIDALESLRYLRIGDRVSLVPDLYLHLVEAGYTHFVRRKLLPQRARISSLSLPGQDIHQTESGWAVTPDSEIEADILKQFIEHWEDATAINVRETEPSAVGETVFIHLVGQTKPIELVVIAREPELVLARPAFGIEYRMGDLATRLLEPSTTNDTP